MMDLPSAPLSRVLARADSVWSPATAPHHLVYGQTGSGKTTLIRHLLNLCPAERVLVIDPKQAADPSWPLTPADPAPVTAIEPMFGYRGAPGGGQHHMWYRLTGSPDRPDTGRRIAQALDIVAAEGHTVLVLDDVREICRQLRLAEHVDSVMNLGRSAGVCAILSATEAGYVSGRSQAAITWIGATSGLDAAKAGAAMLGHSGRNWYEITATLRPHTWIYHDSQPGNPGPCITAVPLAA
jgi:hypothetical protein